MTTKKQANSYYERAFFRADSLWYNEKRTFGMEVANQMHGARIQRAWDKWGTTILREVK